MKKPTKRTSRSQVYLSKSKLMNYLQCTRQLWLKKHIEQEGDEDPVAEFHFDIGNRVGEIARSYFPKGVLINSKTEGVTLSESLKQTRQELQRKRRRPIFEATFEYDGVLVQVDLLIPGRGGVWKLVEVKSSHSAKKHYYPDIAIQRHVLENCGIELSTVELAHVNSDFTLKKSGDYDGLLKFVDVWDKCDELYEEVAGWVDNAKTVLSKRKPRIPSSVNCHKPYNCSFIDYCFDALEEDRHPIDDLYNKGLIVKELTADGYEDLIDVPMERLKKYEHKIHVESIKKAKPIRARSLCKEMEKHSFPHYFLDFETAPSSVPVWKGTHPGQQVPFQWSCHHQTRSGTVKHYEFLHNKLSDPRPAFIKTLLDSLGKYGSIFVYHNFEYGRLVELQDDFPRAKEALQSLIDRLVDLKKIAQGSYHHPSMRGSWSLKAVAPTISKQCNYDEMEIGNGELASVRYFEMIAPNTDTERKKEIYQQLLTYCKMDTEVMVDMVHYFSTGKKRR